MTATLAGAPELVTRWMAKKAINMVGRSLPLPSQHAAAGTLSHYPSRSWKS